MWRKEKIFKYVASILIVPIISFYGVDYFISWTEYEESSPPVTELSFQDKNALGEWWTTLQHPEAKRAYFYADFREFASVLDQSQRFQIEAHCNQGQGKLPVLFIGITKDRRFSGNHQSVQFDPADHFAQLTFEVFNHHTYEVEAYFTQGGTLATVLLDDIPALYSAMIAPEAKAVRIRANERQLGDFHLANARDALNWVQTLQSC